MTQKLYVQARFLANQFKPLNVGKVLLIVKRLGCDNNFVYLKQKARSITDVCTALSEQHHPETIDDFWFWGGPPGNQKWIGGTMYQYLLDRLMYELAKTSTRQILKKLKLTAKKKTNVDTRNQSEATVDPKSRPTCVSKTGSNLQC